MNSELIEKFLDGQSIPQDKSIRIDFKKRNSIFGHIIREKDYEDLKSKNFWRIVSTMNMKEFAKSKNLDLAKLYHGMEITKLTVVPKTEKV